MYYWEIKEDLYVWMRSEDTTAILIGILVVLFIVLFWGLYVYLMLRSIEEAEVAPNTGFVTVGGQTFQECPLGACATNIYNGGKRCATVNGTRVAADLEFEVCNTNVLCDNPITPYALQSDGSTAFNGVCEPGVACRCLRQPQCADYILSVFETANGNPYETLVGQRLAFPQSAEYTAPVTGVTSSVPPIVYQDPSTTFCAVPIDWLPRTIPGCNFATVMTNQALETCMGGPLACDGAAFNPCLVGVLAFVPPNFENFNASQISTTPLSCVRGQPCPCDRRLAVWDAQLGALTCNPFPT